MTHKNRLQSVFFLMALITFSPSLFAECLINDPLLHGLQKLRSTSCQDWPYEDHSLSQSSCQECVERLSDVCRFVKKTPMTREQKENLDQHCAELKDDSDNKPIPPSF